MKRQETSGVINRKINTWRTEAYFTVQRNYYVLSPSKMATLSYEEVERLAELVRKNRFLYDPSRDDHKDHYKAENAWKSIAELMDKVGLDGE